MFEFLRRWFAPSILNLSPVTLELTRAFREGEIVDKRLQSTGISYLTVKTQFGNARVEWFSEGTLMNFTLGYQNYPYPKGDILIILSAAQKRAEGLFLEDQKRLEAKLISRPRPAPPSKG